MTKPLKTLLMTTVMVGALTLASQSAMAGMFWDKDDFSAAQLATVKVNITEAIAKAKEKQTGTVVKAKLEKEDGKFMYEIEFLDNGKEMKVMVDAVSGRATPSKD